jgi:ligand-binding sensor domain-containing protein
MPVFTRIKIYRNDGSNVADYLLEKEVVTCIAVDAGNRKWFGTQGSGVYLMSADGTKAVSSFNTQNSPLPSNYISSLVIDHETGEVIIGTDKGIVALRGSATEGKENFGNIYAFPNPVRPDYSGIITIAGLMTQSNIKITDVAGNLVYETTSVGGQALWNGTNLWGEKVKSGVYLVFVASEDGTESGVTKIAIIR